MMTFLPTINQEKRPFDSIADTNEDVSTSTKNVAISSSSTKRVKKRPSANSKSATVAPPNGNATSFGAKMIIQLTKSATASLDKKVSSEINAGSSSSPSSHQKIFEESPIQNLASIIALPISNPKAISSSNLSLVLSQLTPEIARFDNSDALPLIQSILKINWIYHHSKDVNFSKHYATFLTVLVSTFPSWWKDIAHRIIKDFTRQTPQVLNSHHETLKKLISLAPTSSNSLPRLLKDNFPNRNSPKSEIINYVKNILHLTSYYNVLINHVWTLVFENFIKLDQVNSKRTTVITVSKNNNIHNNNIGDLEGGNNDEDDENEFDDDMLDSEAEYNLELESLSDLSSKLDNLLSSILEYLTPNLSVNSLESGHGISIFTALTNVFRTITLPTHGTKATQYILFYAAQQQPELIDAFLVSLFEIAFNTDKKNNESSNGLMSFSGSSGNNVGSLNIRITGIQYIASFVARASKMSATQIHSVVTFLVDYCTAYMEENEDDDDGDGDDVGYNVTNTSILSSRSNSSTFNKGREFNPNKHTIFYSLVQALMYIVCFRHNSLRVSENDDSVSGTKLSKTGWVAELDRFFTRAIISKYDPLRWCNETVVLIFSRVSQSEGICYTWSVLERIKRERVGRIVSSGNSSISQKEVPTNTTSRVSNANVGTSSSMRATQEFLDLVAFFPFD
ncbi:RNA polymerase I-specific transcription initiation factor RRN3, partial [Pichia kudriavzevii]